MPKCKNNSNKTYKGTEPSPKGKGYCAGSIKVGIKKKGKDCNMWIVKKNKNGIHRWAKLKTIIELTNSQKKTLIAIKKKLKNMLKENGITFFIETNTPTNSGIYVIDTPLDNVANKLKVDFISNYSSPVMIAVIKKNKSNKIILDNGGIYIQHFGITYSTKKKVIQILKDMFGNDYKWSGKQHDAIFIKL